MIREILVSIIIEHVVCLLHGRVRLVLGSLYLQSLILAQRELAVYHIATVNALTTDQSGKVPAAE